MAGVMETKEKEIKIKNLIKTKTYNIDENTYVSLMWLYLTQY